MKFYLELPFQERITIPPNLDLGELPFQNQRTTDMNITTKVSDLRQAIAITKRCVPGKPSLPSLSCLKLETKDGQLTISASDVDRSLTVQIPCAIEAEGSFLVSPTKLLIALPADGHATLIAAHGRVTITGGKKKAELLTLPVEEWPKEKEFAKGCEVDSAGLRRLIAQAFCNVAQIPGKESVEGVRLEGEKKTLTAIGTNGKCMIVATMDAKWNQESGTIPMAACADLLALLPPTDNVNVSLKDKTLAIRTESLSYRSTLMDYSYPAWEPVMQRNGIYVQMKANRENLVNALSEVCSMDESGANRVDWNHDGKNLSLTARTQAGDKVETSVEMEGREHSLALNSKYLLGLLKATADTEIELSMNEDSKRPYFVEGHGFTATFTTLRNSDA